MNAIYNDKYISLSSVADPGFPRGGGATLRGCQYTILPNFPKNCMKLKEFGPQGAPVPHTPLLRSATDHNLIEFPICSVIIAISNNSIYTKQETDL